MHFSKDPNRCDSCYVTELGHLVEECEDCLKIRTMPKPERSKHFLKINKQDLRNVQWCELCGSREYETILTIAHSKKRRHLRTREDWTDVAKLCQEPCHKEIDSLDPDVTFAIIHGMREARVEFVFRPLVKMPRPTTSQVRAILKPYVEANEQGNSRGELACA